MDTALAESLNEALNTPWILDCDTTVKPLYGHQTGAEVSYNPQKPGRPSPAIQTYWISTHQGPGRSRPHDGLDVWAQRRFSPTDIETKNS